MTDIPIKIQFVKTLSNSKPSRIVAVKADGSPYFELYVTDRQGVAFPIKDESGAGGITNITSSGNTITITGNSTTKNLEINSSILTLINSSVQAGDNISFFVNDAGYLTLADIPTFNPLDYDLEYFTNIGVNPFVKQSELPTKTSDLTNDGEDGVNPFITANDLPSLEFLSNDVLDYTDATTPLDPTNNLLVEQSGTFKKIAFSNFSAGLEIIDNTVTISTVGFALMKSINIGKLAGYKTMTFHVFHRKNHASAGLMTIRLVNSVTGLNDVVLVSNHSISTNARFSPYSQFHISIDTLNSVIRKGGFANNDLSITGFTDVSGTFPITLVDDYLFEGSVINAAVDPVTDPVYIYLTQIYLK